MTILAILQDLIKQQELYLRNYKVISIIEIYQGEEEWFYIEFSLDGKLFSGYPNGYYSKNSLNDLRPPIMKEPF